MIATRLLIAAAALASASVAACATAQDHDHAAMMAGMRAPAGATATAGLMNAAGASIGTAAFTQGPTGVLVQIEATGLTPGWHGVHIHATGQCAAPFTSAGGHVNHHDPKAPHGLLNAGGPDDGDMPNIYAGSDGVVKAQIFTPLVRLAAEGPGQPLLDADGSSIVIHANADDQTSQPIGGAGDRVACGVVAEG
ncbi:superoxide dismutase [Brevundimonas sp. Leaf363]|nr:superoxide dismutase family protein [Brevundimonas sp. Leaf363]KQS55719.1 superoxide dismutase [Brevundimonas sp. Leaf363]